VGQWRAAVTENTRGHVSLTEQMDTTTPGEFLFHVFDALAQFERSLRDRSLPASPGSAPWPAE
jgi:DNA invertase Pin-like site-specific DNA recombinase